MKIRITVLALLAQLLPMTASASLVLAIDNYTSTELAFSISGLFDADTIGDNPGILAIKRDWSNNLNTPTELWTGVPTITQNVRFNDVQLPLNFAAVDDPTRFYADSLWFYNQGGDQDIFEAGTKVSGSIVLAGTFDPIANPGNTIQLVSGFNWFDRPNGDYARLEASPVPLPAAAWLFGSVLLGLAAIARRKRV